MAIRYCYSLPPVLIHYRHNESIYNTCFPGNICRLTDNFLWHLTFIRSRTKTKHRKMCPSAPSVDVSNNAGTMHTYIKATTPKASHNSEIKWNSWNDILKHWQTSQLFQTVYLIEARNMLQVFKTRNCFRLHLHFTALKTQYVSRRKLLGLDAQPQKKSYQPWPSPPQNLNISPLQYACLSFRFSSYTIYIRTLSATDYNTSSVRHIPQH